MYARFSDNSIRAPCGFRRKAAGPFADNAAMALPHCIEFPFALRHGEVHLLLKTSLAIGLTETLVEMRIENHVAISQAAA